MISKNAPLPEATWDVHGQVRSEQPKGQTLGAVAHLLVQEGAHDSKVEERNDLVDETVELEQ